MRARGRDASGPIVSGGATTVAMRRHIRDKEQEAMADRIARDDPGDTPDVPGYVARAWEFAWPLRLAWLVVFANVWLAWRKGPG